MNRNFIKPDAWSIIEEGYDPLRIRAAESLFSLGNGAMGQRANFEERYSGDTFQGSYIAGIYYPDKTRVGWWKIGYPEYFAKVLNAPNWIGIDVWIDGEELDLAKCVTVDYFRRQLNMQEGWYERSFEATLPNGARVRVVSRRFLSLEMDEIGVIRYSVIPLNRDVRINFIPYLDSGVENQDANWDDKFWDTLRITEGKSRGSILTRTRKTEFYVAAFMNNKLSLNGRLLDVDPVDIHVHNVTCLKQIYEYEVERGQTFTLTKTGGYVTSLNHDKDDLEAVVHQVLDEADRVGYYGMLQNQTKAWADIWNSADITVEGDLKAQQGIRFNIFQLNQTYLGRDHRLNIGPKGFTGEKYGGSTYWDTEAFCLPFYQVTKGAKVARNLLNYRYQHLEKAIQNAAKLGFDHGAALYPMVTINGEECHNEWEITFEEIHRNGAIVYAIYNYTRYTGDNTYIPEKGLEVIVAIARFWSQRAHFSQDKKHYVILGVTGPNEYENNINNNWYTNYLARWCLRYATEQVRRVHDEYPEDFDRIVHKTCLTDEEIQKWIALADQMYLPYSEEFDVYLQQDGFLDKERLLVTDIPPEQSPINQHWSWDRILRSPFIKQADVLQGFYFFEDHFSKAELERHFDFYEPITVHESSLSPCVHSILAASLNRMNKAYEMYLRTSRLDLDDYNKEVHEGLHITSMAGTWLSIVEGFGGMRVRDDTLTFTPRIPIQWDSYSFKVNFREFVIQVVVSQSEITVYADQELPFPVLVNDQEIQVETIAY